MPSAIRLSLIRRRLKMPKRLCSHIFMTFPLFQLLGAFIIIVTAAGYLHADVIYLKDGTQLETDKAWEENGLVRFYLKGTDNIIITYSKEIVDRVEAGPPYSFDENAESLIPAQPLTQPRPPSARQTAPDKAPAPDTRMHTEATPTRQAPIDTESPESAALPPSDSSPSSDAVKNSHFMFGAELNGIPFYDPRREPRYQTDKGSLHNSLEDAIAALAEQFSQPPEWIKQHIGDTNDLGEIYRNLNRPRTQRQPNAVEKSSSFVSGIQFYNPRRVYKYWISETGKYNSYEAAIAALAQQFDSTPEWITAHMGDTNDLGEIHQNLMESKIRESGPPSQ